jgi:hypothetical protein
MSIFDRIFVGKVIKDFGPVEQKSLILGRYTKSILLVESRGKLRFVLKTSAWIIPFSASVSYHDFSLEDAYKLRDFINESEQIARNLPPSSYDPRKEAIRDAAILAIIGAIIVAFVQSRANIIIVTLFILAIYALQQWGLRKNQQVDTPTRLRLALIASLALFIGSAKVAFLTWRDHFGM